jgi:multiple sugar transport system substrate-binding protein
MAKSKMDRRNFLKMAALTATSAALASCAAPATTANPPAQAPAANTAAPAAISAPAATAVPVVNTPVPAPTNPPAKAPVTIKWWDFPRSWAGAGSAEKPNAWNEDLVKQYMTENPNVTIEFTGVSWGDGPQKLDVALTADQGPDVMYGYPALFGKMLSLNVLQDITSYISVMPKDDYNDFYEAAWKFATNQGKVYAFPWYYGTEGEWAINTTIVKEAGAEDLLPKAPDFTWTPDQMVALYQKCTFKRATGDQVWGTVIYTSDPQGINLWPYWSYPYMYGASLYSEQDRKSDFGSDAGVKAFQLLYDLVNKYKVAPPGAAGLTSDNLTELWNRKQDTVIVSGGVELMTGLQKAIDAGTIQAPFEVLPVLPPVEKGQQQKVSGAIGVMMDFAQKDTSKIDEVIKFSEWLTNAKNMEVFGQLSKLCARKSTTQKLSGDDPLTKWRIEYVMPNMAAYSKDPADIKIDDAWMQALQAMYDGKQAPEAAAKAFQDEANKLLQGA